MNGVGTLKQRITTVKMSNLGARLPNGLGILFVGILGKVVYPKNVQEPL